jgi:hypothetical protein
MYLDCTTSRPVRTLEGHDSKPTCSKTKHSDGLWAWLAITVDGPLALHIDLPKHQGSQKHTEKSAPEVYKLVRKYYPEKMPDGQQGFHWAGTQVLGGKNGFLNKNFKYGDTKDGVFKFDYNKQMEALVFDLKKRMTDSGLTEDEIEVELPRPAAGKGCNMDGAILQDIFTNNLIPAVIKKWGTGCSWWLWHDNSGPNKHCKLPGISLDVPANSPDLNVIEEFHKIWKER